MRISKIDLQHFRGIEDLHLDLDGKSTIFFGVNGVGKTSILRAIDLLYANIIGRILGSKKKLAELTLDDIRKGKGFARIEAGFVFMDEVEVSYHRMINGLNERTHSKQIGKLVDKFERSYIVKPSMDEEGNLLNTIDDKNMPIFVNYGVNRLVPAVSVSVPKKTNFEKMSAFDNAIESLIDFRSLFEWFRLEEDYENQLKIQNANMDYERKGLTAVRNAMRAMFDTIGTVHVDRENSNLLLEKAGDILNFNQLSDGEKCTMALFGDLARRLAIANPTLDNPLEGTGVVLIDEIDLHLHTQWQRKILRVLRNTFPKIQFLITTHSPQILGEADEHYNLVIMRRGEDNIVSAEMLDSMYGWDTNVILEDVMETNSMTGEVKKYIEEMYDFLHHDEYALAEQMADKVDEITKGRNPDTAVVRTVIRKMRRRIAQDKKE